jgi:hypothetical protein
MSRRRFHNDRDLFGRWVTMDTVGKMPRELPTRGPRCGCLLRVSESGQGACCPHYAYGHVEERSMTDVIVGKGRDG